MGWKLLPASEFAEHHRRSWDELNSSAGGHILLDSQFVALLIRHFGVPKLSLGVAEGARGMALVHKAKTGSWQTFQPSQAPIGLIVLADGQEAPRQVWSLMRSLPMSTMTLSVLQQDPACTAFVDPSRFGEVEVQDYIDTARITVHGSFDDFWKTRNKNLTQNLSRRRRRLDADGVRLEMIADRDPSRVAECIEDYGRLEQTGWKGRQGTAVTAENAQGEFYREMLEAFCERGHGVIYRLKMDGKTVAANLCVERSGTIVILKIAYDESVRKHSPGMFLHYEIFKALFSENRIHTVEFYGRALDWHRRWTDEIRTMFHLTLYRNRMARLMHRMIR